MSIVVFCGRHIWISESTRATLTSNGFEIREFASMPSPDTFTERLDATVLVTYGRIDLETATSFLDSQLKLIVLLSTGFEECVSPAVVKLLNNRGIAVTFTPGFSTEAVAEFGVALTMIAMRRVHTALMHPKAGLGELTSRNIANSACGILGLGRIGQSFAEKMVQLGARVSATTRRQQPGVPNVGIVSLDVLIQTSDVVAICASLNPSTQGLFDLEKLVALRERATIVNIARPDIIDPAAAAIALVRRPDITIAIDGDVGLLDDPRWQKLALHHQVLWTPHVAFNTESALYRATEIASANIMAYFQGEPTNLVSYL